MTMTIHPKAQQAIDKVDGFMAKYPALCQYEKFNEIEEKFGHSKVFFFVATAVLLNGILFLIGGAKLITDLISFVYPAYMSFKAIDSAQTSDDTQWLTYWVVFSFASIIEQCCSFITNFIPFYFYIKLGGFLWLYHPKFLGAQVIYAQVIRPLVLPYMKSAPQKKLA